MRKILIIMIVVLASLNAYEVEDFKKGYQTAIASITFSAQNDGIQPKEIIDIIGKNILYIDTDKMPTSEILFTQYLAHREGFKTHIVGDRLFLGTFTRLADAEEAQAKAKKLSLKAKIIKNNKTTYFSKTPITDIVVRELISEGGFVNEKVRYITKTVTVPAKTTPIIKKEEQPIREFRLKNYQAQAYELKGDKSNSGNYVESQIIPNSDFKTNEQIITNENEVFIKIIDKNLYFLISDTEFR